jgi:hypothetical protein
MILSIECQPHNDKDDKLYDEKHGPYNILADWLFGESLLIINFRNRLIWGPLLYINRDLGRVCHFSV